MRLGPFNDDFGIFRNPQGGNEASWNQYLELDNNGNLTLTNGGSLYTNSGGIDTGGGMITTDGGGIDTGGGKITTHGGGVDPAYLELDAGMNQRSILAKMKEDDAVRMPGSLWMYYDASTSELMALMPVSTTTVKQFEIPMTALPDITTDLTPSIKAGAGSAVYKSN